VTPPPPGAPGARFEVEGGGPLRGRVRVPGDKSVSHRALLLGALAEGTSHVRGLSDGDDVGRTAGALRALGARIGGDSVEGGRHRLHAPSEPLDAGNSGTTMRLLAGLLAGHPWTSVLVGDASLSSRPMDRVAVPLRAMGASVEGIGPRLLAPLTVRGGSLHGIDYTPEVPSAQVKSCVLLAATAAEGDTVVHEAVLTRRHTEELLVRCGAQLSEIRDGAAHSVRLTPGALSPFVLDVPGDPSQAAFWLVAACVVPHSVVTAERIYVGTGRRGYLDVLARMGASLEEADVTTPDDLGPTADVTARHGPLVATDVDGAEITGLDEVPVLAVAAAHAEGETRFRGVGELRVKESDRLAGVAELVRAFGGESEVAGDDLVVVGTGRLSCAAVDARGDHRMAMAAVVAGLAAGEGTSAVHGWEAVATSYPGFATDLAGLRAGRA
jgi:3-phosphoshikimate 1-carboxyvinyltransferase